MSARTEKHGKPAAQAGFEHQDVGVAGIVYALAGLALFCLVVHFLVTGLYHALDRYYASDSTTMSPLVTDVPSDTRHVSRDYPQAVFPKPKLEEYEDERGEFRAELRAQEATLNSYAWVDEKAGVARIPIDQAMQLIAHRGLPVQSEPSSAAAKVPAKKAAKK